MNVRVRVGCAILRYERLLWVLLAACCLASALALPRLELAFGFKGVMREGHPDRVRLEAFEREFRLGDSLLVYFHGPAVFTAPVLRELRNLSGQLERTEGVRRVFSAVDLLVPAISGDSMRLVRLLGPETLASPEETRRVLSGPPFTDRWIGYLYDRDRTVLTLIVRPREEFEDPRLTLALLERIESRLRDFSSRTGVRYHLNGLFYLNGEMVRSTFRDQAKLTLLGVSLLVGCFWLLFGSLALAVAVLAVLAVSILLAFGTMVLLGVPLNGLSGNLPVITLVNGLEDVVHLLVVYLATRQRAGASRSAATAVRICLVPNFLTSLTTFGALIVTMSTEMELLAAFGWAICIGVVVEYFVAILYLPLVLNRLGTPARGTLHIRLLGMLRGRFAPLWDRIVRSRANLVFWLVLSVCLVTYTSRQRLNSNWYRYFVEEHPVTQSMEFLEARGFPIATIDCSLPSGLMMHDLPSSEAAERDLEAIRGAVSALPDVKHVDDWGTLDSFIDERLDRLEFPEDLAPRWVQARREAFHRMYTELGAFDEYYAPAGRKLRIAVATDREDALGLLELAGRVRRAAASVPVSQLAVRELQVSGSMAYWSAIMGHVSRTFFENLAFSLAFVYLVFIWMTGGIRLASIAMVPNVLPIFAMFAAARALGYDLNESFCVLNSLAVGNSVNDTIHYIFHIDEAVKRGIPLREALRVAFDEVGLAMILSSALVAIGFLSCLPAEGVPVILSGVYMCVACVAAIILDVFLLPSMLVRLRRWR